MCRVAWCGCSRSARAASKALEGWSGLRLAQWSGGGRARAGTRSRGHYSLRAGARPLVAWARHCPTTLRASRRPHPCTTVGAAGLERGRVGRQQRKRKRMDICTYMCSHPQSIHSLTYVAQKRILHTEVIR